MAALLIPIAHHMAHERHIHWNSTTYLTYVSI
jgi:hypothetical protein